MKTENIADSSSSEVAPYTVSVKGARLGQLFFSTMSHWLYDSLLYKYITGTIWRCSQDNLLDNYVENISGDHLEVGVGSGYLLSRTLCAEGLKRLVLLDLNRRCLAKSESRLSELSPWAVRHNVLEPLPKELCGFGSIGMNYVLHCIPGSFRNNRKIFSHLHAALRDGGVLFGATLIPGPLRQGVAASLFMSLLRVLGIFHNSNHTQRGLKISLEATFKQVNVTRIGSALIFVAVK